MKIGKTVTKIFLSLQFIFTLLCGVVSSFVFWFWRPSDTVPLWTLIVAVILIVLLVYSVFYTLDGKLSTALLKIEISHFIVIKGKLICLLYANDTVKNDDLLTIADASTEEAFFSCYVSNVQGTGIIQITILNTSDYPNFEIEPKRFAAKLNEKTSLQNLTIRRTNYKDISNQ